MSDDRTDQIPGQGAATQVPGHANPGPTDQSAVASRQLVRDPYSRLGGVASGLAHYFGLDVSLVRLGFVLFTVFSGVGLVIYLLAWLVVPRAEYWPPAAATRPLRSITARETGVGLAVLGGLLFLFFNGGGTARILVPVLLVAGGVWLLRQDESVGPAKPGGPSAMAPSYPAPDATTRILDETDPMMVGQPFSSAAAPQPSDTLTSPLPPIPPPPPTGSTAGGPAPGSPVPPRRRRWRRVVIPLLVFFVFLPLLAIALVVGLLIGNGVDFNGGFDAVYRPLTVEDIPARIDHDAGSVELDLTRLDVADFDDRSVDTPISIDIEMSVGEITVIVPEGLAIEVDAAADVGDVAVFDRAEEGIDNDVTASADDPAIELEIDLGAGKILVERG